VQTKMYRPIDKRTGFLFGLKVIFDCMDMDIVKEKNSGFKTEYDLNFGQFILDGRIEIGFTLCCYRGFNGK
jgi:hypothetical protein